MAVTAQASIPRLAVSMSDEDNDLLIKIRAALERRTKRRLSLSEVVRTALRTQAKAEGIIADDVG